MMLYHKAWRESRARFLLGAGVMLVLCVGFVWSYSVARGDDGAPMRYSEFIWRAAYNGYARDLFVLLTLMLGLGGLLSEQLLGTAGFTLALPVSRHRLMFARSVVGILQVGALAFVPAVVIPLLSPAVNEVYPWNGALRFAALWTAGGGLILAIGLLASVLVRGDYSAPGVGLGLLLVYAAISDAPIVNTILVDPLSALSGSQFLGLQPKTFLLIRPAPWATVAGMGATALAIIVACGAVVSARDF